LPDNDYRRGAANSENDFWGHRFRLGAVTARSRQYTRTNALPSMAAIGEFPDLPFSDARARQGLALSDQHD
jgi:hypothetical protein